MRCNFWQCVRQAMLVVGGLAVLPAGWALAVTGTVAFQNGVGGYTGTFDRKIDELASAEVNGSAVTRSVAMGCEVETTT